MNADDWRTQAACRNLPTTIFYPDKGTNAHAAKMACGRCPVRDRCAADGAHEATGIWGGMSPLERGGTHNRGQRHRIHDVAACPICDTRFWTPRNTLGRPLPCPACRVDVA